MPSGAARLDPWLSFFCLFFRTHGQPGIHHPEELSPYVSKLEPPPMLRGWAAFRSRSQLHRTCGGWAGPHTGAGRWLDEGARAGWFGSELAFGNSRATQGLHFTSSSYIHGVIGFDGLTIQYFRSSSPCQVSGELNRRLSPKQHDKVGNLHHLACSHYITFHGFSFSWCSYRPC